MKKKIIECVATVVAFLVIAYAFVPQVLSGKIVNQSDISGWSGAAHETMSWNASHPDRPAAWTGSMFSGMPTTTIQSSTAGDWTQPVYYFLLSGKRPANYLFISLIGAWLLMLCFGISPLLAAAGAVAVTFCSYNMQIIQVGHNTKMQALAFLPWALAAFVFTYRRALKDGKWLAGTIFGAVLFAFALSFQIKANHQQISYYLAIMIICYVITLIVWLLADRERRRRLPRFFAASGLLLVLGLAGIATNASKLLPTMEYTPYSMRGGSSSDKAVGDGADGLKLDYATAWSYGWEELPNLLVPNFNGGSSAASVNPDKSETIAVLKRNGQSNVREIARCLPMYWGSQPFTAGPMYMGAITVFLFVLGLMLYRGKEKWWLLVVTLLAVFLALGNHFMWFTRLFYDWVPLYNKFRTVSMALTILQFTLPLLAFLVLDRILRTPEYAGKFAERGWIALLVCGGFCLLCAVFPSVAGTFSASSDEGMPEILQDALAADRRSMLMSDAWRSFLLIAACWAVIRWTVVPSSREKRELTCAAVIAVLILFDLFATGKRYLNSSHFVSSRQFSNQFTKREVDKMILEDTDPSYRVLDLTGDVFNDSHASYWHKNIGGYSPAKLQRYQEYIDSHLRSEIALVGSRINEAIPESATISDLESALPYCEGLARLNCRYIILDGGMPPLRYPYASGNAWFEDADAGDIKLSSYAPDELEYSYSSEREGRAVFSEVYYPAGWKAVLDNGRELPIELYGELFRSVVLPEGEHTLLMRFEPRSYSIGEKVSRVSSILLVILLLCSLAGGYLSKRNGSTC